VTAHQFITFIKRQTIIILDNSSWMRLKEKYIFNINNSDFLQFNYILYV